jgi:hypothetical protein
MEENCIRSTRPTAAYLLSSAAGREELFDLLQYITIILVYFAQKML